MEWVLAIFVLVRAAINCSQDIQSPSAYHGLTISLEKYKKCIDFVAFTSWFLHYKHKACKIVIVLRDSFEKVILKLNWNYSYLHNKLNFRHLLFFNFLKSFIYLIYIYIYNVI